MSYTFKSFTTPTIQFPGESIQYLAPSWDEMNQLAFQISRQILAKNQQFDRIVTLAKGGWPLTRSLVDFLSISHVASIGVKFYTGINQRLDKPEIYQDIPVSIKGEKILLFDDVADSGESLKFVKKYLEDKSASQLTTAALYYKPHSIIKPDYFGAETTAWIIFPYDVVDTINILGEKWLAAGIDKLELMSRFAKLNFKKEWVEFYLKNK